MGHNPQAATLRARRSWYQFSTLCLTMWLGGWNDASLGPLLTTIQDHYKINYTLVSTLFLFKCVGFIVGSVANMWLTDVLGFGKARAALQTAAYAAQAPAPPFPVLMAMHWVVGVGMAIQAAQSNGFVAAGKDKESVHSRMSMLHGLYGASDSRLLFPLNMSMIGLGAVLSPFAATPFAHQRHWSYINIISCGLSLAITFELWVVFKGKTQEGPCGETNIQPSTVGKYKQLFSRRVLHYLAFVIVFYTGLEITIGGTFSSLDFLGWIVTYLMDQRGVGVDTGYVSSGFYGGLMIGSMALPPFSQMVGRRRVVFVYSALAAAFDVVVWQVRHLIGDAIAVSFMGMFLGPIYPLIISGAGAGPWFPPHLVVGAIGWIAGFGQGEKRRRLVQADSSRLKRKPPPAEPGPAHKAFGFSYLVAT
ncbi:MFS general substrate transporter [Auricularia subglabra TFB-10046 SS5]|uniref:MFS general substrate transporter n=1 Tax=Auricularia subglabra (strain TFB-10046 / SS5) TaxID=717982 RepID=J0D255_AURST|nr:MFS general substrate transporter [Auricularia subglabra TFB-10046 SS5]